MTGQIEITLKRSPIAALPKQRATLLGLGLTQREAVVYRADTPAVRGMIRKVIHLVSVRKADPERAQKARPDYEITDAPIETPVEKPMKEKPAKKAAAAPADEAPRKTAPAKSAAKPKKKEKAS
jgi:large subunit ribosomal protein L30